MIENMNESEVSLGDVIKTSIYARLGLEELNQRVEQAREENSGSSENIFSGYNSLFTLVPESLHVLI